MERLLRADEPGVSICTATGRDPDSVVLGIRSYEDVLGDEHAQFVQRAIVTVYSLLFVGCGEGLRDPNFGKLIEWTGLVFAQSEYRRYRLALESEREELQKQHPPEQRLFVISYGQQHSDLAPFLRSLGAYRPHATPTPHAAAATPGVATLPARPRCFGREAEIEALVKNLLAPRPEPTPILGAPGIGKSTLTLAALHDEHVAAHYGARRYFIRCDGVKSRLELVAALALAFGLTPSPNIEPAVLVELAKVPTALAIDNAETPWEADTLAVEEFLALLAGIPGLALIASVRGAQRPMGVSWHESLEPTRLKLPAAREAFLAIAGKKFQTDPRLNDMVQAMDGVPLAITLLAYQAEGEPSLEPLWQRWQHERTAMLQRAEGQDRLTNIELSYEISLTGKRMTEAAHRLLRLLALLPDGLAHRDLSMAMPDQAEAASSILRKAGLGFDEAERLRLLKPLRDYIRDKHLRDKHLLQSDEQARLVKHFGVPTKGHHDLKPLAQATRFRCRGRGKVAMWGKTVSERSGNTSPKKRAAAVVPSRARQSKLCSLYRPHLGSLFAAIHDGCDAFARDSHYGLRRRKKCAGRARTRWPTPRLPLLPCLQGKPLSEHVVVHRGLARR